MRLVEVLMTRGSSVEVQSSFQFSRSEKSDSRNRFRAQMGAGGADGVECWRSTSRVENRWSTDERWWSAAEY